MSTAKILRCFGPCLLLAIILFSEAAALPQSSTDYVYVWQGLPGAFAEGESVGPYWTDLWLGYGTGGVSYDRLWLRPAASTAPAETHSAMVRSNFALGRVWDIQVPVITHEQLRTKKVRGKVASSPHPWEVAWLVANMTDDGSAGLYFIFKTNGVEMGAYRYFGTEVIFLYTDKRPTMALGKEYGYGLFSDGNTLTATINNNRVAEAPLAAVAGWQLGNKIGLYTEDAKVSFGQVEVKSSIP